MTRRISKRIPKRRGAVVVLFAIMAIVFVGLVAFAVDYGYILSQKTDLQRAADAAALAAVQDLSPDADGDQGTAAAKATVREYVASNLGETGFNVADADIQIGRFDTSTIYSNVTLLDNGVKDAVRVTLRRDGSTNERLPLIFARAIGISDAALTVSATAVLQKPSLLPPGAGVLPFAVPKDEWDDVDIGESWIIYGDGRITDSSGHEVPGNWGTTDIGNSNNSTNELRTQIEQGLQQSDLNGLHDDGRISSDAHIDATEPMWLNSDPGLSAGIESAVQAVQGQTKVIPLFDSMNSGNGGGGGNNLEYRVVGWGVVTVGDSNFNGANNSYVRVRKTYLYGGKLMANGRLDADAAIQGAFSSPALVE